MKCENCGKEIDCLRVNVFQWNGTDKWEDIYVQESEDNAVFVDTTTNWTGYGMSDEEMVESICCPHCKKFPFKSKEVQMDEILRLVMFKDG